MASSSGTATLLYPKPLQSPRLLRRNPHYSGLRLVHPFLLATVSPSRPGPPSLAAPRHRRNSTTIHASAAASFPASPTPAPCPPRTDPPEEHSTVARAGRSKKHKKSSGGRIEGSGDVRREAKSRARIRSRRLAENAFYRRKRRAARENQADAFTDAELEMIGLGYDRSVRFMDGPDDPRLRHPHDWYRFGRYGPYSWRGIVVGPPIRGRFSDDRVSLMSEVSDHDEWDRVEQFDMSNQFSNRLNELDAAVGFRYYWVFVRHPRWRPDELPWEQWTLSAEVAVQSSEEQRLDKWSLMGRLGNPTRELITRCAAWTRPDIIYVKRPLYQSRFEPQKDFYSQLRPLVDPATENQFLFDLEHNGEVIRTTYFGGLCRIVKASPKVYVDDVVNAYSKLSDADKNRCLEFLLTNHPVELLHPYTKEWKVKLEEMELGCDAPDENESDNEGGDGSGTEVIDWVEDDGFDDDGGIDDEEHGYEDEEVIDVREEVETEEVQSDEESEKYWDEQWKQAMKSSDKMEKLVKTSIEASNKYNKQQMQQEKEMRQMQQENERRQMQQEKDMEWKMAGSNTMVMEQEQTEDEDEQQEGSRRRSVNDKGKSKAPGHFLRAAVRPFTYRNLVKEIVLMRHFIVDGEIV